MSRRIGSSFEDWAAILFASARTGVCAYRAATQSVVHDEAFTFLSYLHGPWRTLYFEFNANNHLLFSILTKFVIQVFGLSESTLRLVSVTAGFFLIMGIYRVLKDAETPVALRWATLVAIGLHPLLLDFCVAARGYSLALACLIWAIAFSMRGRDAVTGLLLGLGMSANLSVALPALGLLLSRFALSGEAISKRALALLKAGAWATLAIAACCGGTIRSMTPDQFVSAGMPTIRLSLDSLVMTSVLATSRPGFLAYPTPAAFLEFGVVPAVTIIVALAGFRMWRGNDSARARFQPAAALGLACAAMVAGHYLLKLNYPVDRTGLSFIVLAAIACAIAVGEFKNPWLTGVNVALAVALLAQFVIQFHTDLFPMWRYDRSTKQIAQQLAEESQGKPPASVRVSATWIQQPALEFYRIYKNIASLQPVERRTDTRLSGFDYYVLNVPDSDTPEARAMEVLLSDPVATVILARERR